MSEQAHPEQQDEGGGRLSWFLAGALVGTVLGFLFAPRSGKETRAAITSGSQEFCDRSREIFERSRELMDDAADLFERGRKLASGME